MALPLINHYVVKRGRSLWDIERLWIQHFNISGLVYNHAGGNFLPSKMTFGTSSVTSPVRSKLIEKSRLTKPFRPNKVGTIQPKAKNVFQLKKDRLKVSLNKAKLIIKDRVQEIRRENIWTIPNLLCFSRIAVCPYLGYTIVHGQYSTAAGIFIVAALSDILDGYIARKYKSQSSILGTLLDPLADKLLLGTMYLCMAQSNLIPVTLTVVVIGRDVLLASAGLYLRFRSLPLPRSISDFFDPSLPTVRVKPLAISKFNTVVQVFTAAICVCEPVFCQDQSYEAILMGLWWITGVTTISSFFSYVRSSSSAYKLLRRSKHKLS